MPYVNIQLIAGVTRNQKQALVQHVTEGFAEILRKRPEHLHIVIQEIPAENWGYAGELSDDLLARNPETYCFGPE